MPCLFLIVGYTLLKTGANKRTPWLLFPGVQKMANVTLASERHRRPTGGLGFQTCYFKHFRLYPISPAVSATAGSRRKQPSDWRNNRSVFKCSKSNHCGIVRTLYYCHYRLGSDGTCDAEETWNIGGFHKRILTTAFSACLQDLKAFWRESAAKCCLETLHCMMVGFMLIKWAM